MPLPATRVNNSIAQLQTEINAQVGNLVVDGFYGSKNLAACPTLKIGAIGNITKWLQKRLTLTLQDGKFGTGTLAAVKVYQKALGLVPVGDAAMSLFRRKEEDVANKIGIDTYNADFDKAKLVWGAVDEEFRITPRLTKTIEAAQALFAEMLLKVIPGLSIDDIEHLRKAVAGEVNIGKEALIAPIEIKQEEQPIQNIIVESTRIYATEDGIELVPKITPIATATIENKTTEAILNPIDGQPIL